MNEILVSREGVNRAGEACFLHCSGFAPRLQDAPGSIPAVPSPIGQRAAALWFAQSYLILTEWVAKTKNPAAVAEKPRAPGYFQYARHASRRQGQLLRRRDRQG